MLLNFFVLFLTFLIVVAVTEVHVGYFMFQGLLKKIHPHNKTL